MKRKVVVVSDSDVMLKKEVEKEARLSAPTIWRMQKAGTFPPYFKLSPKKNALHRRDFDDWKSDPPTWAARKASTSEEASHG
jgi:predicted DNA-binding transcriptional regulator AlpA